MLCPYCLANECCSLRSSVKVLREALIEAERTLQWLHGDSRLREWVDDRGEKQDPYGIRSVHKMVQAALKEVWK
jgi:hypothetical protein